MNVWLLLVRSPSLSVVVIWTWELVDKKSSLMRYIQHSKHMKGKLSEVNIKPRQHRDSRLFQNTPAKKREQQRFLYICSFNYPVLNKLNIFYFH